jgi:uncharacterized protein
MPPISLLIKPASGNCNLRCKYCFYHDIAEKRSIENYGMMDIGLLEDLVKKALEYAEQTCVFAFQGGEPTLIGLNFYKKLIEVQKKYNKRKIQINNALQTNGHIINEQWAKFLAENKFLVGISLDGPKDIHDANRIDAKARGTFNNVMNAIELFNKYKVEYNILSVVNGYVARHASKVYNFFKKNNFKYLQFIPCLDALNEQHGSSEFSLKPERFTYFLKSLFDLWYEDIMKGNKVSIRYFDNIAGMYRGYRPEACGMLGRCQCQFVVEANGGVYPCDFYVIDEWLMGNIKEKGFEELKNSDTSRKFVEQSLPVDPICRACKWFNLCRGGCRRDREPFVHEKAGLNYYCKSYQEFFIYSGTRFQQIAAMFMNRF